MFDNKINQSNEVGKMKVFITLLIVAVFAAFTAFAEAFKVDGKLVFDNFNNWSWNEERGGFTNPNYPKSLAFGNSATIQAREKYGKAAIPAINKAQRRINRAHEKWRLNRRWSEDAIKLKMIKRSKQKKADLLLSQKRMPKIIAEYIKNKPTTVSRSKIKKTKNGYVMGQSWEWYYWLDKLKKRKAEIKKSLYNLNNSKKLFKKRIADAKAKLHQAYLNMAKIKAKALAAQKAAAK